MTEMLPENIGASYPDRSAGDAAHQHHHDVLHGAVNALPAQLADLQTQIEGRAPAGDYATAADLTALQGEVDGKAPAGDYATAGDLAALQDEVDGKAPAGDYATSEEALVGTRTAPAVTSTLSLLYSIPVTDPDLKEIIYAPPGGVAAGLAAKYRATYWLNERGFPRTQMAPDQPDDIAVKWFGNPQTKTFTADIVRAIPDRLAQGTWVFGIKGDGRIDNSKYPWTDLDHSGSTGANYGAPSGTTYWPGGARRVASDKVELRGSVNVTSGGITSGDVIGTVPADCKPSRTVRLLGSAGGGAQGVRIEIDPNGTMTAQTTRASGAGYIALDGLSYTL